MAGVRQPLYDLTPDDRGPAVLYTAYILTSITIVFTIIRFWLALHRKIPLRFDDATYVVANVFAIASSATLRPAVNAGLGRHMSVVDADNVEIFFKAVYASQLLGLVAMFFAKVSVTLLLHYLVDHAYRHIRTILSVILAWVLFSFFAIAFQCPLPHPWDFIPSQCPTGGKLLYPIIIFNILTDAILAVAVFPYVWKIDMPLNKRLWVCVLFGSRLIVLFPTITELALLGSSLRSTDRTWASVGIVLCEQITIYISIICATLPRTNQFLSGLDQSQASAEVPNRLLHEPSPKTQQRRPPKREFLFRLSKQNDDDDGHHADGFDVSDSSKTEATQVTI